MTESKSTHCPQEPQAEAAPFMLLQLADTWPIYLQSPLIWLACEHLAEAAFAFEILNNKVIYRSQILKIMVFVFPPEKLHFPKGET